MKFRTVLQLTAALGVSLFASPAHSDTPKPPSAEDLRKLCETVLCRKPSLIRLTLDSGKPFEQKLDSPQPIVRNGWVSIFAGETIFVEAEVHGDQLINIRAVETDDHPEKTLTLKFSQDVGSPSMTLIVRNPFERSVKYHAGMMLPADNKVLRTSSCPVVGNGGSAFESWPNAILQLVLFDFRLLGEGTKQSACEF
jgi:hypothetical protein